MVGREGGGPEVGLGLTPDGGNRGPPPCIPPGPNAGGPLLGGPPPSGGTGIPVDKGEDAKGPGRELIVEEGKGPEVIGLEANGGGGLLPGGRLEAMKGGNAPCGGPVGGGTAPLGTTPGGGGPGREGPENGDDENGADEGNGC